MMKTLAVILIAATVALSSVLALAHPNHGESPPITKDEASARGDSAVSMLVKDKQLPESWQKRLLRDVSSRQSPAGLVWVLRYENPVVSDKDQQTLYIFIDEFGNYLGGNHSGKI